MMNYKVPTDLLDKYLSGNCTDSELNEVQSWYNSFEHDDDYVSTLSAQEQATLERFMFLNILSRIDQPAIKKPKVQFFNNTQKWVAAAASVVIVLGFYFYAFKESPILKKPAQVASSSQIYLENSTAALIKKVLPDNSLVWLSPGASISYSTDFIQKERKISMNGECFFDVTKDPAHPFVIQSNHLITKVWGTSFRVSDVKGTKTAQVTVVTGKVSVKSTSSSVILLPNQKVIYAVRTKTLNQESSKKDPTINMWERTKISFDNEQLINVLPVLNKKFNVNIHIEDSSLNAYHLNADFSDFNLPEILETLKKILNIDYTINQNDILLKALNPKL